MLTCSDICDLSVIIMSKCVSGVCFYSPEVNVHPKPGLWKILADHWLIMHGQVHLLIIHQYLPCCWIEIGQQKDVLKHHILVETRRLKCPFGCSPYKNLQNSGPYKNLRNSGLHSLLLSKRASVSITRLAAWESHKRTGISQNSSFLTHIVYMHTMAAA